MAARLRLVSGLLALALGASAAQAGEAEKGRALAVKLCALCHVIDY